MNEHLKAKSDKAAELLNADGSVTPASDLPAGLLVEEGTSEADAIQRLLDLFGTVDPQDMMTDEEMRAQRKRS